MAELQILIVGNYIYIYIYSPRILLRAFTSPTLEKSISYSPLIMYYCPIFILVYGGDAYLSYHVNLHVDRFRWPQVLCFFSFKLKTTNIYIYIYKEELKGGVSPADLARSEVGVPAMTAIVAIDLLHNGVGRHGATGSHLSILSSKERTERGPVERPLPTPSQVIGGH